MLREDPAYAPETAEDVRMDRARIQTEQTNRLLQAACKRAAEEIRITAFERGLYRGRYYEWKKENPTWEKIEQDLFESFYEAVTEYIEYVDPDDAAEAARD